MTDEKMQPTGSDVDTAKLLAKDFGVEFEYVPTTGATRIPSLQSGKADLVISTLSMTPERAQVIDFSVAYAPLRTLLAGKLLGFDNGVTLHGGQPVPVTTCVSGSAFDIAGRGVANVEGIQAAFEMCVGIARAKIAKAASTGGTP